MTPAAVLWVIGALFGLSGVSAVGCQTAWSRLLAPGLGHETPAILGVVTAFFGGLSLGAWTLDPWIRRGRRPGRLAAGLEAVIGGWGMVTAFLLPALCAQVPSWLGTTPRPGLHGAVAFLLPFVSLLPATLAMGATLPAVERFARMAAGDRPMLGAVYAANTLGAVVGVILATFVLPPALGFRLTLVVLAAGNLACAAGFLWAERHVADAVPVGAGDGSGEAGRRGASRWLIALFGSGLLGIGYEVVGLRLLARVLENTVYTYAVVVAVFLLATALGAAWFQAFWRRRLGWEQAGWVAIALASTCLAGGWALWVGPGVYTALRGWLGETLGAVVLAEGLVAAMVFGGPSLLMGMLFSLLVQEVSARGAGVGKAVAVNLAGSALAAPVFGSWMFPLWGGRGTWMMLGLGYLALVGVGRWRWGLVVAVLVPVGLAVTLPSRFPRVDLPVGATERAFREGRLDAVSVWEFPDGNRSLFVNERFGMGGTGSWVAERRQAHLPLLLHPAPRRALFLGAGTGITFAGAAAHPGLVAEGVELLPEVVSLHGAFAPWNNLPADGRLQMRVADARRFVGAGGEAYDVIVADLFHPARDGAGMLYTREHFTAVRNRLLEGGLFCQWLPLYQLDGEQLRVIARTFLEVFPGARAYLLRLNLDTPVLGLVGGGPGAYEVDWMERRVAGDGLQEELRRVGLGDAWQLLGSFLGGPEALRRFAGAGVVNTDDRPVVMFAAPYHGVQRTVVPYATLLEVLEALPSEPGAVLKGDAGRSTLTGYFRARDVYLRGLVAEEKGRVAEAVDRYVESARLSPEFTTGYARCLTLAMQQAGSDRAAARRLIERLVEARPERPVAGELLRRLDEGR